MAFSYVRCLFLRSTFAATAPRSAVAELGVVRRFLAARIMKTIGTSLLSIVTVLCCAAEEPKHNYIPKDGYVPTADAAIKIAVAVWEPIYGAAKIADEKPFRATLTKGVWTVEASLPKGSPGGVALAEISKADGRILRVSHGK